jgi:hypothetical protein
MKLVDMLEQARSIADVRKIVSEWKQRKGKWGIYRAQFLPKNTQIKKRFLTEMAGKITDKQAGIILGKHPFTLARWRQEAGIQSFNRVPKYESYRHKFDWNLTDSQIAGRSGLSREYIRQLRITLNIDESPMKDRKIP